LRSVRALAGTAIRPVCTSWSGRRARLPPSWAPTTRTDPRSPHRSTACALRPTKAGAAPFGPGSGNARCPSRLRRFGGGLSAAVQCWPRQLQGVALRAVRSAHVSTSGGRFGPRLRLSLRSRRGPLSLPAGGGAKPIPAAVPPPFSLPRLASLARFSPPPRHAGARRFAPAPHGAPFGPGSSWWDSHHPRAEPFSGLCGVVVAVVHRIIVRGLTPRDLVTLRMTSAYGVAQGSSSPALTAAAGKEVHHHGRPCAPAASRGAVRVKCTRTARASVL
jgi:hypothetical protein